MSKFNIHEHWHFSSYQMTTKPEFSPVLVNKILAICCCIWRRHWQTTMPAMVANVFLDPSYIFHLQQLCRTGSFLLLPPGVSHVVAEHDVLLGQLQQHRVVEELVDTDVFTETLQTTTHSVKYKHQVALYRDQQPITAFGLERERDVWFTRQWGADQGTVEEKTCINCRCCQKVRTKHSINIIQHSKDTFV